MMISKADKMPLGKAGIYLSLHKLWLDSLAYLTL